MFCFRSFDEEYTCRWQNQAFPASLKILLFVLHAASASESAASRQMKVMIIEPASFDDAQQVADHLKNRKPVVVNFENTDADTAKRIIDFISGTTYALAGDIKKVGKNVFLCAPSNVNVAYTQEDGSALTNEMPCDFVGRSARNSGAPCS